MLANIGLFHFSFSIRNLVPLLFTPPSPLIPIYYQPSRIENVFYTFKHLEQSAYKKISACAVCVHVCTCVHVCVKVN